MNKILLRLLTLRALMPGRMFSSNSYRYGFNGKEKDDEINNIEGAYDDFGARMYDSRLGRWMSTDFLAEKYPFASPYNFVLNSPIQAKDPDGEKVLFVNGYYNTGVVPLTFVNQIRNWLAHNVIGTVGGAGYWGSKFITETVTYFGAEDEKRKYIDGRGALTSNGEERFQAGYDYAKAHLKELTDGMVEGETFKVVSHSMGSAYSEGIIKYLEEKQEETGHKVEKVVHLSPADPSGFTCSPEPLTIQLKIENDIVLGYKNFGEGGDRIKGVDMFGDVDTDDNFFSDLFNSHADTKFDPNTFNSLRDLENSKFEYKFSYSPTGRSADILKVYDMVKTTNGTKFNTIFKGSTNYTFTHKNRAVSNSAVRFK